MTKTILNSFDIWTDARAEKHKGRVRSIDNISLEGIVHLRALILEMAVHGKLVKQDPKDEPVNKRITKIASKENPFKLPQGWCWYFMGDIGNTNVGLTYKPTEINEDGTPVLRSSNIQNGKLSLDDLVRVSTKYRDKDLVENGDLLICARNGSQALVGKCAIIEGINEKMTFGAFMAIFKSEFNPFVKIFMDSPLYRSRLEGVSTTTINQITQTNLKSTLIPLPPLEEQKRIVIKVKELMALCDRLENKQANNLKTHQLLVKALLETLAAAKDADELQTGWQKLASHFDTVFCTEDSIELLKETILQLAVMGRLVKQNPKDEPASELLKKIKLEKQRLIAEDKIKKSDPLPEITESEKPFALPKGWEWVRLGSITNKIGSGSTPRGGNKAYTETGVIFLRSQNVRNEGLLLDDVAYIGQDTNEKMSNTVVLPNDILLNITGGSLGRSTVFPKNAGKANVSQHVTIIRPTLKDSSGFLHKCILSPYIQKLIWGRQVGANREGLSKKVLELFEIPYPPIAEQRRIIDKVEELTSLCDRLKERIVQAQEIQVNLSKTIVENALS